jgi:hypothetical protein
MSFVNFCFVAYAFWCHMQNLFVKSKVMKLFPCFLLRVLYFSVLFWGLLFILSWTLYMVWVQIHSFPHGYLIFSVPLLDEIVLSSLIGLGKLVKNHWPYIQAFISRFSFLFHWFIYLSLCQYHTVLIIVAL